MVYLTDLSSSFEVSLLKGHDTKLIFRLKLKKYFSELRVTDKQTRSPSRKINEMSLSDQVFQNRKTNDRK